MHTKSELYAQAQRTVAGRRQKVITLAQQTQEKARAAIPGLAQLEGQVRAGSFQAARLAALGAGPDKVRWAQEENRQAQQQLDELLRSNGYNPQMLEPRYSCPLCRDRGVVDGRPCRCVRQLARQLRREELLVDSALTLSSFDTLDMTLYPLDPDHISGMTIREYMTQTLASLRTYAETFDLHSSSLLLFGNAGLGKTHAALAIANTVLDRGFDVIYISSPDLCAQLERARFEDDDTLMRACQEADLLILDDLGTESLSSYTLSCLYTLVNDRMAKRRPTIYTTNIVDSALLEKRYTEKIASRLSGSCEPVEFIGSDVRQLLHLR